MDITEHETEADIKRRARTKRDRIKLLLYYGTFLLGEKEVDIRLQLLTAGLMKVREPFVPHLEAFGMEKKLRKAQKDGETNQQGLWGKAGAKDGWERLDLRQKAALDSSCEVTISNVQHVGYFIGKGIVGLPPVPATFGY